MGKITEEELEMLSPEERDAIKEDADTVKSTEELRAEEEAEAARAALEAGAGAAQRNTDKKLDEKTDAEVAAEAASAEAAAKLKADEDAVTKEAADKEVADKAAADAESADKVRLEAEAQKTKDTLAPLQSGPLFTLEAEKKHGTKAEIEAKMTELDTKFEDGDIKLADYNKERAEYVESLTEMKMFDSINAQVQKASAEKAWKDSQVDFFKENSEYLGERIKNVAFVDAVNRLLATEESKKMTDAQIFAAAKTECDTVFHPPEKAKAGGATITDIDTKRAEVEAKRKAEEDAKTKALDAARKLEADKSAGVKTLAKVPVSEGNTGVDKYDIIDKLTGEAYEEAVAKMSDAERTIYAARA